MPSSSPAVAALLLSIGVCLVGAKRSDGADGADRHALSAGAALQANESFKDCKTVAPDAFPGLCDEQVSGYACYSTKKMYTPKGSTSSYVIHWACSDGHEPGTISDDDCKERPWQFSETQEGQKVEFTADPGIYEGACQFGTAQAPNTKSTTVASAAVTSTLGGAVTTPTATTTSGAAGFADAGPAHVLVGLALVSVLAAPGRWL
mmetsp:Transcript_53015/g.164019  ORF Transcript_53015/g.164019 Transcript_53015/m.164019 type:complete len:205 (+) Transcript_53015:102-716(+)